MRQDKFIGLARGNLHFDYLAALLIAFNKGRCAWPGIRLNNELDLCGNKGYSESFQEVLAFIQYEPRHGNMTITSS